MSPPGLPESIVRRALPMQLAACLLAALLLGACSHEQSFVPVPNQPPTVEISQAPLPAPTPSSYAYEISWVGYDRDGRVVRYAYALDPPSSGDTVWVSTTKTRGDFIFRADSVGAGGLEYTYHTFVVKAFDDRGGASAPVWQSFTSSNIAPTVAITSPTPNALIRAPVGPIVNIRWTGGDLDGSGSKQPTRYRWKLFSEATELQVLDVLVHPDTLRTLYAPRFDGWQEVGGDVHSQLISGLIPGRSYVFVLVAFDEAGGYSAVLSPNQNILVFTVSPVATLGPRLTLFNDSFFYAFPGGGIFKDPEFYIRVSFAADAPISLNWTANVNGAGFIRGYRWAVDLASLDDETPRSDEAEDLRHWTRWGLEQGVRLPAFSPPAGTNREQHHFYLEAEDDVGGVSLAVIEFDVVRPAFDKELLVVDDTWMTPDLRGTGTCTTLPRLNWPGAAELDTFLYAVGGKPWRCMPEGSVSPAGLLAGYDFDTVGTQFARVDLARLGRYRNILWLVDGEGVTANTNPFGSGLRPMPQLHAWSTQGASNPLSVWVHMGGRLWLAGGGAAYATLRERNLFGSTVDVYTLASGEVAPGAFIYDIAGWHGDIHIARGGDVQRSDRAVADWAGAPDYSQLPAQLLPRAVETDPLPAGRTSGFYLGTYVGEYMTFAEPVLEPASDGTHFERALDTLYVTGGGNSGSGHPIMTYYHGNQHAPMVFSGFPPWYFQRAQGIELVDFVLQRMWGLQRKPVPR